jgi:hypothetical protein
MKHFSLQQRLGFLILLVGSLAGSGLHAQEISDETIVRAIEAGKSYLYSEQLPDGSWEPHEGHVVCRTGPTSLACYALLAAGEDPQSDRMKKALGWLSANQDKDWTTYSVGIRSNVWELANRETNDTYLEQLKRDIERLIYTTETGSYGYYTFPRNPDAKERFLADLKKTDEHVANVSNVDNSNAQYGLLGAWAAKRNGIDIPRQFWSLCMTHWMNDQNVDGGWGYGRGGFSQGSYGAMSAAGLASLFVCFDALFTDAFHQCNVSHEAEMQSIHRALNWFEKNFERSILAPDTIEGLGVNKHMMYYLYGVERIGLASGYKYFGRTNWFEEGTKIALGKQKGGEGWGNVVDTSFALLFLARGRQPILFNKLEARNLDWNNRPRELANLTRFLQDKFEKNVHWQIITMDAPVQEWHDAPILYISASIAPDFTPEQIQKLRDFVYQGGLLFTCTECGGAGFKKGMRDTYEKIFPGLELKEVPEDHPLYSASRDMKGEPPLYYISNGLRPLALHCDIDLPLAWQRDDHLVQKTYFDIVANMYMFFTDKGEDIRHRGVHHWPEEPTFTPKKTAKVVRVRHDGQWDPEPYALDAVRRKMGAQEQIEVKILDPVGMEQLADSDAQVAFLTGIEKITLTPEQQAGLKSYVQDKGGMIVVDAAGGSMEFYQSMFDALRTIFGEFAVGKIPADADILTVRGKEITEADYRRKTKVRIPTKAVNLMVVQKDGKTQVVLSREDITGALIGYPSMEMEGYMPSTAYQIARNAILTALEK